LLCPAQGESIVHKQLPNADKPPVQVLNLFEPDVLARYEYSNVFRRKLPLCAEQRLMFAVLTDAVECFQRYHDSKRRHLRALCHNAETWIMNRSQRALFSFENVCESLNIDPAYLRQGLLRWRATQKGPLWTTKKIRTPLRYKNRVCHGQRSIIKRVRVPRSMQAQRIAQKDAFRMGEAQRMLTVAK
jgi:hypothetical protein